MSDILKLNIKELKNLYQNKQTSPREVINEICDHLEKNDKQIGAYVSINKEQALKTADKCDLDLPLGGIPIAIKDNINVLNTNTSCSSKFLLDKYTSPYNATVINNLISAGAIPLGKTNMDEFAMGSSTENSAIQLTRNPKDTTKVPGGSSGGSAAAVSANLAICALGTDTGGSIRQPASFCGCVGLKPTYGRVSRYGLVAFASSLDQIGPITKTVSDSASILNHISSHDINDSTSIKTKEENYIEQINKLPKDLTVGVDLDFIENSEGIDDNIKQSITSSIDILKYLGIKTKIINLNYNKYAVSVYYIIATAEASTNLARFDSIRYGKSERHNLMSINEMYEKARQSGFGHEVKRRILLGTYVLSSGYYDAYYLKAQKIRRLILNEYLNVFKDVDIILTPTTPTTAFNIKKHINDPLKMYLADVFTIGANLAGIPAMSVPYKNNSNDMPIGIQFLAKPLDEKTLLQTAYAFEQSFK